MRSVPLVFGCAPAPCPSMSQITGCKGIDYTVKGLKGQRGEGAKRAEERESGKAEEHASVLDYKRDSMTLRPLWCNPRTTCACRRNR